MNFFNIELLSYLLVFLPLIASLMVGLTTRVIGDRLAQVISCSMVVISALCAFIIFNIVALQENVVHMKIFNWISSGNFSANWGIYIDTLTSVMLLLVTSVSSLVHIYSIGYMSHDEFKPRFMAYLSLFTFFMIALVTADNFIQMFFGWEGVGLASYLLIGFWFHKPEANNAAMKAFIVNRIGDFGFALGIFMVFWYCGSVEFLTAFASVPNISDQVIKVLGYEINIITLACVLLFIGAMGKSAQLGLHVWLPDAMEGPTPVSALIHAATMVTAGIFMVARCSPIFEYSSTALIFVTCVGAFTCLFAASIALVQNDIKRIIAYSTCSQLGYMFFACGVSAYSAGIFHLFTHGFFKALLFLGAGSVIHAVSGEQDIRKMGGLWNKIPFTYLMMWVGSLALAGIFPFAGFYSKDVILEAAIASNSGFSTSAYILGLIAAVLTAFYSWRLIIIVFHGRFNGALKIEKHIHESPLSMTIPLFILAIGAASVGYIGAKIFNVIEPSGDFWNGSILVLSNNNSLANIENIDHIYGHLPLAAGILGILSAYIIYNFYPVVTRALFIKFNGLYKLLYNKYYFDEVYKFLFIQPAKDLGRFLWLKTDTKVIDGVPNISVKLTSIFGYLISVTQTGFIYRYTFVMVLGLITILGWTLFLMQ